MKSNVFVKPNEQRPTDRAARGEPSLLELSRVVTEEGGSQACLGYAMARPDDKPRAISSSLEYCRGAEEEDEVNFRSSESRTLSLLNCYAECKRKSSSIKRLYLYEPR